MDVGVGGGGGKVRWVADSAQLREGPRHTMYVTSPPLMCVLYCCPTGVNSEYYTQVQLIRIAALPE